MSSKTVSESHGPNTRLAHAGNDPHSFHGFVNPPVVHASTVLFPNAAAMASRNQKYTYGTHGTPTTDALAEAINELEGSAGTVAVPSGLAAVTLAFLSCLSAGDHALVVDSVYGPTRPKANRLRKVCPVATPVSPFRVADPPPRQENKPHRGRNCGEGCGRRHTCTSRPSH